MKYAISLILGLLIGAAMFIAGMYYNPFVGNAVLSPLSVSGGQLSNLSYSVASNDVILITNDGESMYYTRPRPLAVAELWEPAIIRTELLVTSFTDSRGLPAGIGIKMSSPSIDSKLIDSKLLVDSVWYLLLPDRGTMGIYQQENYFAYIRDLVIPAKRSSSDSWNGTWSRVMTIGPNALGTANVFGLHGEFEGLQSEAIESVNARVYSVLQGPVSMTGTVSISLSDNRNAVAVESP